MTSSPEDEDDDDDDDDDDAISCDSQVPEGNVWQEMQ